MVLEDEGLRALWEGELAAMRERIKRLRRAFAEALARRPGGQGWTFVGDQRGMFSLLGLGADQVARLREAHAVYIAPGGRINVAGMPDDQADRLAEALLATA
jgi:aspartate/tyrosine/aromatic aminotransferase